MSVEQSEFWNGKILRWEAKRYDPKPGLVPSIFHRISGSSVQARLHLAARILNSSNQGSCLLDLGCGSGRLFSLLDSERFENRIGIDFSERAILEGGSRGENAKFICGDVIQTSWPENADFITGLGLLDWLDEEQIRQLFLKLARRSFLFSFSEMKLDARISIHTVYQRATSLRKKHAYYPRYHRFHDLVSELKKAGYPQVHVHRDPRLRFGTFISSHSVRVLEHV